MGFMKTCTHEEFVGLGIVSTLSPLLRLGGWLKGGIMSSWWRCWVVLLDWGIKVVGIKVGFSRVWVKIGRFEGVGFSWSGRRRM